VTTVGRMLTAIGAGTALLVGLIGLYFVGQVTSFENPSAPAWQRHFTFWWILAIVLPGVVVGLIAERRRGLCGAIAGASGSLLVGMAASTYLAMRDSLAVDHWWTPVLFVAFVCVTCSTFAWLTGILLERRSPNKSLERTRKG
jgi:CDP-diglyceride synthetase